MRLLGIGALQETVMMVSAMRDDTSGDYKLLQFKPQFTYREEKEELWC